MKSKSVRRPRHVFRGDPGPASMLQAPGSRTRVGVSPPGSCTQMGLSPQRRGPQRPASLPPPPSTVPGPGTDPPRGSAAPGTLASTPQWSSWGGCLCPRREDQGGSGGSEPRLASRPTGSCGDHADETSRHRESLRNSPSWGQTRSFMS